LNTLDSEADADGSPTVVEWVTRANRALRDHVGRDPMVTGMATTVVVAVATGDTIKIAHVGDSRAYLLRDGALLQLTEDHSHVQRLMDVGLITAEEATRHPARNLVTRALGLDDSVEPDETVMVVRTGDRLLLCTDGITKMLDDDRIQAILAASDDPDATARQLVEAANEAGGEDNATAVVIHAAEESDGTHRPRRSPPSDPAP
jgi:protein phosphatase